MARPKKTETQLAEMRARILDAAYALLKEQGYPGVTSRAIADRLGVAHMGLYTYFPNQAAILDALSERELGALETKQQKIEQLAESQNIVDVMRTALAFFPQFEKKHPAVYHLAWMIPLTDVDNITRAQMRAQANVQHLTRLIEIGIAQGVFEKRDPWLAAAAVFGMINTPLILFHSGRLASAAMRDKLVAEMLDAAISYLIDHSRGNRPGG